MNIAAIRAELFRHQDPIYREFQCKLIPNLARESIIGVRTNALRQMAKELSKKDCSGFLQDLAHQYFEENQLHSFIIADFRDFAQCLAAVDAFLPYIDNWATCDQLSPKIFAKHKTLLLEAIYGWMASEHVYSQRFGIGMLMRHFLDADFESAYLQAVADIFAEDYYLKMMIAWYFATALAKQYQAALPYLEQGLLPVWIHNKTIQKALESLRISPEQKVYLRKLRRKERS